MTKPPKRILRIGGAIWTLFFAGLVAAVSGGVVVLLGGLIETKYPNDDKVWSVKAVGYGLMAVGLLVMSLRRSLTLNANRGTYSSGWGFGIVLFRKTIPWSEFAYVLFDMGSSVESRMSTRQHRVCLVSKADKIGALERVDMGAQAVEKIAGKMKERDIGGLADHVGDLGLLPFADGLGPVPK